MDNTLTYRTLVEAALDRARKMPDKVAYEFLQKGGARESLTYSELHARASAVAGALRANAEVGSRVLLPSTCSLDFHVGFLACQYAGMVAVPVPKVQLKRSAPNLGLDRFIAVVQDSGAAVAVFCEDDLLRLEQPLAVCEALRGLNVTSVDRALGHEPMLVEELAATPDTLAFLQYSSGSTGNPKGVMLTHGNIMANQRQIQSRFKLPSHATIVSWLPLYHDMGLCSGMFLGLYLGVPAVLMNPISFVARPYTWLKEISRHEWVLSGAPNFAYALCTCKIDDETVQELDLSGWQRAFNGAEPIQASTMTNFAARFAPAGFDYEYFYPCYGLAEATLFVTGGEPGTRPIVRWFDKQELGLNTARASEADPALATPLVGCGRTASDAQVAIVAPGTHKRLDDGQVGEIWISSPSAGTGYWEQAAISADTFGLTLQDEPQRTYFRTGDLGFFDGGELFVSGRIKEMIIINGVNYYPQDIERAANSVCAGLRVTAAFATGEEPSIELVVVAEASQALLASEDEQKIINHIRKTVNQEFQLSLSQVILTEPGSIPRTTSGKIQRCACEQRLKDGVFGARRRAARKAA